MKSIFLVGMVLTIISGKAQTCDCETEFSYIKNTIEKNFSGVKPLISIVYKMSGSGKWNPTNEGVFVQ